MGKSNFAKSMAAKAKTGIPSRPQASLADKKNVAVVEPTRKSQIAPSRVGKTGVITFIEKNALKHLKVFCIENEVSQQQVMIDALNAYFLANGRQAMF